MTTSDRRPWSPGGSRSAPRSPRRWALTREPHRPALALVRGGGGFGGDGPVELRKLTGTAMPAGARGALVTLVDGAPGGRLQVVWAAAGARLQEGGILLSWADGAEGLTDVTAHLGLPGGPVLLARWPGLRADWSDVVRPTVAEVRELHAALRLATVVLGSIT